MEINKIIDKIECGNYDRQNEKFHCIYMVRQHIKQLEQENKALKNGIDLDLNAKLLSENEKLKKKINILTKCIPYYNYKALHSDGKITDEELEILENN